jgi:formylglycine-generating enzyme required for sulfatase activity
VWLCLVAGVQAGEPAAARFQGTGKADPIRITNVACQPAEGAGAVTFDLAWDHSWRAAWTVPAEQHGGQGTLAVENWDAAWVFVKFRQPGAEGWSHATLSVATNDHQVPVGAKLELGLSDNGQRGLGVFIYRNAPGSGPNDWKSVKLRWQHGADGLAKLGNVTVAMARTQAVVARKPSGPSAENPDATDGGGLGDLLDDADAARQSAAASAKRQADAQTGTVELRVCVIPMVYVPQVAFWAGDGTTNLVGGQFSAGNTTEPLRIGSEQGVLLGGSAKGNLGNRDRMACADDFSADQVRWLPPQFPKGYDAFYCMKYEITQGEMVEFLNTLDSGQQAGFKELIGAGKNGLGVANKGSPAVYASATPYLPCAGMLWNEGTAYAAWAGLRPMSELEFEKACRGPLKPVPDEYAWGTAAIAGTNEKDLPRGGYALRNAGKPDETVVWEGGHGPDATRGNAAWIGSIVGVPLNQWGAGYALNDISRPLRVGIFATPESGRVAAGASYWGIMELSGGLCEYAVTVGNYRGRRFVGVHGDGSLAQPAGWYALETSLRVRGGGINAHGSMSKRDLRVSDRRLPGLAGAPRSPMSFVGFRGVRSAVVPAVASTAAPVKLPPGVDEEDPSGLFNEQLRIENVTLVPRDAKSALLRFDVAWNDSWRSTTNYDAAWVFFKAQAAGSTNWQHVKLVADKVLNPTGYAQERGTQLEFVVPDGPDGFTGVFLQRAAPGAGPLVAKGVTVVCERIEDGKLKIVDSSASATIRQPSTDIHAFGIEMVYVPEGPFYLGSGGTEPNRFYQYTDGSQNNLPYRVADAGPLPTGPQAGRLWATEQEPDGRDAGELPAAFPNGYRAFYCMKHCIKQGQFAGFLGMQSAVQSAELAYRGGNGPVVYRHVSGGASLTWEMGAAFGAWAGLRPMTELEYEKACRGPRAPQPDEAAPSYWGIPHLNMGEMIMFVVSVATPAGRNFTGSHGNGTPALRADWPSRLARGVAKRAAGLSSSSGYFGPFEFPRISYRQRPAWEDEGKSTGVDGYFYGWRGVRTAPVLANNGRKGDGSVLELDPLPDLSSADVGVFYLSGRFRSGSEQAQKVEVMTPLPEVCFPDGAASRTFTATPNAVTPFRILTVLTRQTARTQRKGQFLPVQVALPGGAVLAEQLGRLPQVDPQALAAQVVYSLDGGALTLRVTNSTERACALTLELLPPAGMAASGTSQRLEVAPGTLGRGTFALPGQVFRAAGFRQVPYRVTVATGLPQAGEILADLCVQSRWWTGQMGKKEDLQVPDVGDDILGEVDSGKHKAVPGHSGEWGVPPELFQAQPKGWATVTHGTGFWLGKLTPLPEAKSITLAATRVLAPEEREALLKMGRECSSSAWTDATLVDDRRSDGRYAAPGWSGFIGMVRVNGEVVYDSRTGANTLRKPVRLRKGENTLLVQCRATEATAELLGNFFVLFYDAKDGRRMDDLVLDVARR